MRGRQTTSPNGRRRGRAIVPVAACLHCLTAAAHLAASEPTTLGDSLIRYQRGAESPQPESAAHRDATAQGPSPAARLADGLRSSASRDANIPVEVRSIAAYQAGDEPSPSDDPPPPMRLDAQVRPAGAEPSPTDVGPALAEAARTADRAGASASEATNSRKLGPRSTGAAAAFPSAAGGAASAGRFKLPPLSSFKTAGAGLAIVIGLFLICAWLARRSRPHGSRGLPAEAFAVLGRSTLAGGHSAHLVRLGNKLVLLSVSADRVQPLAEVTETAEVERIAGLCASSQSHGPSAEFRQVLDQLARTPAKGFLD